MSPLTEKQWVEVWKQFDHWYESHLDIRCDSCGRRNGDGPEWDAQQEEIMSLVNQAIRLKGRKR